MTGGGVTVLGPTGVNFGAGMTGGFAFVLDTERMFYDRFNHDLIDIHRIHTEAMEAHADYLRSLIEEHARETGSVWAQQIIEDFEDYVRLMWLASPKASELNLLLDTLREAA